MKQYPIAVYPGIFKCLFILLGSLLFLGLWLVVFTRPELGHRWLAWLCLAMGAAGFVAGGWFLALRFLHKPLVWIHADRAESFLPIKNRYETVSYAEVEKFVVWRSRHLTCIVALGHGKKMANTNNAGMGAAVELWQRHNNGVKVLNINSALVADINAVCDLLNRALADYRSAAPKQVPEPQ